MEASLSPPKKAAIVYPESDGKPMADNTKQLRWIFTLYNGIAGAFRDAQDVFVASNLNWYPVEGEPEIVCAPDVFVAFGRPKGDRPSYRQWLESDVAPQVVFEVLSPGNRFAEMHRKFHFYERFGVEEYYLYNPDSYHLEGYLRDGDRLRELPDLMNWVSPRLGIRFEPGEERDLGIYGPDGRPFATYLELARQRDALTQERDDLAQERDELTQARDHLARERDAERRRAERLAARLRELGIEPE